jgi:hypothetical protein
MNKRMTVEQRREIFKTLVLTQDVVHDVAKSRQIVTQKFGITEAQLRRIEEEGIDRQWPPLEEEEVELPA